MPTSRKNVLINNLFICLERTTEMFSSVADFFSRLIKPKATCRDVTNDPATIKADCEVNLFWNSIPMR